MDTDAAVVELYGLAPEQFIAARNGLAKAVRDSGDEQTAAAIMALRKPTVSAWLANQLVRTDPDGIHALTELGEQLRETYLSADSARRRELTRQRHDLVAQFVKLARDRAANGRRVTVQTAERLTETLDAALVDPGAAQLLRTGQLTSALRHVGFGVVDENGDPAHLAPVRPRALTVSTSVPLAYGHGYTTGPTSRAKHCQNGTVQNCGQIQWEPQSVEGPKGFPAAGPADGKLCSAGLAQFAQLDDQRGGAWPAEQLSAGQNYNFRWYLTAPHATTDFKYYITKQGWNQSAPLTRSALDLNPFLTVTMNGARPANNVSHPGTVPSGRTGRHMILAVWTIHDTANAFYQCSDVRF